MTDSMVRNVDSDELFYASYNESAATTIVFLHGVFSSHDEWKHVIPHIENHHIIVPDLPQHSASRSIQPFSLHLAADKVASLIAEHARDGRAHVVGLSLGGYVAMELARRHPDLVASAFVSGAAVPSDWQVWLFSRPGIVHWGLWLTMATGVFRFSAWRAGLREHEQLKTDIRGNNESPDLARRAFGEIAAWDGEVARDVAAQDKRIMLVAGGQGDNIESTKELADMLQQSGKIDGKQSRGFVVKQAIHVWNLQCPELFAQGVVAWVESRPLPADFEPLFQ